MQYKSLPDGVWPTTVTPFTADGKLDIPTLNKLMEFFHQAGVAGVFGVCQSSEMFFLNLEERIELASETLKAAAGKFPVILSGHISDDFEDQVRELNEMAALNPAAIVLVTNRLASENEDDDVWFSNLERLIAKLPEHMPLGFYECPYPYKRVFTPELLARCAATGRFGFLKDTCCDSDQIKAKLKAVEDTDLKLFNANSATLLDSLRDGASGYSGVMANFHPAHYVHLCNNWNKDAEAADKLMDFLGPASLMETQCYPVSAKYHLFLEGLSFDLNTRSKNSEDFVLAQRLLVEQLRRSSHRLKY